jgi:hypothetical protein
MNPPCRLIQLNAVWLFPLSYAIHLGEEYFAGGGFPIWADRALGIELTNAQFIAWNAVAFGLMCIGATLVSRTPRFRFVEIALAIAVLGNVATHVLGSLATWTYSPGLITSVCIWSPLGVIRLKSANEASTRRARHAGIYIGLSVVVITLVVVTFGTIFRR